VPERDVNGRRKPDIAYKDFFGLKIWVGLIISDKAYAKEMKRLGLKNPNPFVVEGASATTHYLDPSSAKSKHICLICIKPDLTRFGAYGLLVHEAVHVMQRIKEIFREDKIGAEMEAYATQGICSFLWEEYDDLKRRRA
jgi:hypothetical protein